MTDKEIIESGLLESYVLGLSSEEENTLIHAACLRTPQLLQEIEAIEEALISFYSRASSPSAETKKKIMDAIAKEEEEQKTEPVALNPAIENRRGSFVNLAMAASLVFLLGSLLLNFFLYKRFSDSEARLHALQNEKNYLSEQMRTQSVALADAKQLATLATDTSVVRVTLQGQKISTSSFALLCWNKNSKEVFLNVQHLPAAAAGTQYQLWALVDGKPVDAGVFDVNTDSLFIKMKLVENAQAFAVTLEKQGGSEVPTLDKMYLMGEI